MSEQKFANKNELLKTSEPLAWELIKFLIKKLSDEKQRELAEYNELLKLVLAVKKESGENPENLAKIEDVAQKLNAVERIGEMLTPPLTTKEIKQRWMLDSVKKDQAKKSMN